MANDTGTTRIVRLRQVKTLGWTVLAVVSAIGALLLLSTIDNKDGTPWLESTLVGQTLALLGVVAAAVLPSLIAARKDAAVVREQVENRHVEDPTKISNIRDDLDNKDAITNRKLDRLLEQQEQLLATQKDHSGAIKGFRQDLRHLRQVDMSNSDDIRDVRKEVGGLGERLEDHLGWSRDVVNELRKENRDATGN